MAHQLPKLDSPPLFTDIPVLTDQVRAPAFDKSPALTGERNEMGEAVFRFKLDIVAHAERDALTKFYSDSIRDLLKIVRFYYQGRPIIVDAFAFLNNPEEQFKILVEQEQA